MVEPFGVGIVLKWTEVDINKQLEKLQTFLNGKKLDIKINIDDSQFKNLSANLQNLNTNLNKALNIDPNTSGLDKLSKKYNVFTDEFGKEFKNITKETKEFTNNLNQNVKEIQTYRQEVDKFGNSMTVPNNLTREYTDSFKKQREEVDKLANALGNLREKSQLRVAKQDTQWELNQSKAQNKVMDDAYEQEMKRKQEASDYARKLTHEEEQERLKTTTETQKQIEKIITGSNETIFQQQRRMFKNEDNGRSYEQMWFKAEQVQNRINDAKKKETLEIERQLALYKQQLDIKNKNLQTTYGKHYDANAMSSIISSANNLNASDFNSVEDLKKATKQLDVEVSKAKANMSALRKEATLAMKESDSFFTTLSKDFGKMLAWGMVKYGFAVCSKSDSVTTNN